MTPEMSDSTFQPGRYRHYKGNDYIVLGVARHSETQAELVVYRQDYGDRGLWVRPREMFAESVIVNGRSVPRFAYIGPADQSMRRHPKLRTFGGCWNRVWTDWGQQLSAAGRSILRR